MASNVLASAARRKRVLFPRASVGHAAPAAVGLAWSRPFPREQRTCRRGQAKYLGPRPLPGHAHRYRFHLYALDAVVDFTKVGDIEHLPSAVEGHVLASGTLTGTRTT